MGEHQLQWPSVYLCPRTFICMYPAPSYFQSREGDCPRPHRTGAGTKPLIPGARPTGLPRPSLERPGAQAASPQDVGRAGPVPGLELQP